MHHSCRKAAKSLRRVVVCLCVACGSVLERGMAWDEPFSPPASAGSQQSWLLLCRDGCCSAPPGRGESGSSSGSAASPDLTGLCGTSRPSKPIANAEQELWDLLPPAELGSRHDSLGEGRRQDCSLQPALVGSSLRQTKLVWGCWSKLPCHSTSGYSGQFGRVWYSRP